MNCNKCGTENKEGATFCKKCGNSLIPDHICKKCGTENDVDAAFCEKCGEKLKSTFKRDIAETTEKLENKAKLVSEKVSETATTLTEKAVPIITDSISKMDVAIGTAAKEYNTKKPVVWGMLAAAGVAIVLVIAFLISASSNSVTLSVKGDANEGMLLIQQGKKFGLADFEGNIAVPCIYDEIKPFEDGIAKARRGDEWSEIANPYGLMPSDVAFPHVEPRKEDKEEPDKVRESLEQKYSTAYKDTSTGLYMLAIEDKKTGLTSSSSSGGSPSSKWGLADENGKEIVPCIYDGIDQFSEGFAGVVQGESLGFINTKGELVIPMQFSSTFINSDGNKSSRYGSFHEGIALVSSSSGAAVAIDTMGNKLDILPPKYGINYWTDYFSEGLLSISSNGKDGYINRDGDVIIDFEYDGAGNFENGMATVYMGQDEERILSLIDKRGRTIVPFGRYDEIRYFSDDLIGINQDKQWYFVNRAGEKVSTQAYSDIGKEFEYGLLMVDLHRNSKGFVDKQGRMVIPPAFYNASSDASVSNLYWQGQKVSIRNPLTASGALQPDVLEIKQHKDVYNSYKKGYELYIDGEHEKAKEALQPVASSNAYACAYMMKLCMALEDTEKAQELYKGAEQFEFPPALLTEAKTEYVGDNFDALYAKVQEYTTAGDYNSAILILYNLLSEDPRNEQLYLDLAAIAIAKEELRNAQEILQIGYVATQSEAIKDYMLEVNLSLDFGIEAGQTLTEGMKIAEKIAESTGNSDKLELGKELYSILRNLQ